MAKARTDRSAAAGRPTLALDRFINPAQVGGIESYVLGEGAARGVRALCVNTGGGLRYRVLVDRGLDIDQAFLHQHSLAFLSHKGVTPPTRALDRGVDWLKAFPGGLLTSCGPFNIGAPTTDQGQELGLHGPHSTSAASIESIIQPEPHAGRMEMSVTGVVRYGAMFGPCLELRRTIRSTLGANTIDIADEFFNAGNTPTPHAWLLHINLGWPLADEGAEFVWNGDRIEPRSDPASGAFFGKGRDRRKIPAPLDDHSGTGEAFTYLFPRAGRDGRTRVALVNRRLGIGFVVHYNVRQFPHCGNWQHWGRGEYVCALEPMNGTVEGRDKDRARGRMDTLKPGQRRRYDYRMEVITGRAELGELRRLG